MGKTTDQILQLISAGVDIVVNADDKNTTQLIEIVTRATQQGTKVTIANASLKTTDQLLELSKIAKGNLVLDLK